MFNFYLKGGSKMDKKVFDKILETIKNDDIKEYAKKCIDTIPDYFMMSRLVPVGNIIQHIL